ncbi:MAG: hydroxyethylthiazole kinase [Desulfobulbus sp.]|nr:hydroxyethylthiazole kinase [Desulfobulbus sp.]
MSVFTKRIAENLRKIRENKPLVHNITNFVVMNITANVLLACGASPVMAHASNEVEEMVGLADSLVLNIGTLTDDWVITMINAGRCASDQRKPIVLDPVGVGTTSLRTNAARAILFQTWISVVRGNATEILALADKGDGSRRLEAIHSVTDAADDAVRLARELGTTLALTGPTDLVTDGRRTLTVEGGHPFMPYVTGTGCSASALIGAFLSVDSDPVCAAATALAFFGVAGEIAGARADGPGTFLPLLLDALYNLRPEEVAARSRISPI